ncbi:MAG TPA: hypothetical protein P5555_15410 [Candidatus Paceibacterota bacterium]|nr:hypothetical protein [Verrucomicrobiota bacterium]HOX03624.1 hypothetical protein [Verrucomicrobiota bacterium]HRZ46570.1 hypothetical protein [Candidatus Paceibacterota bacterium]HRZ91384.1 hypothetical protein [Candidatus Paceibacterota bacterium]
MDQADNISAGTQVVSRVEVRGTNNSLVHPRGAVGVVTRTPTGEDKRFLVRFPDGFEFSLQREQLEVLKHFKARLGSETRVPQTTHRGWEFAATIFSHYRALASEAQGRVWFVIALAHSVSKTVGCC